MRGDMEDVGDRIRCIRHQLPLSTNSVAFSSSMSPDRDAQSYMRVRKLKGILRHWVDLRDDSLETSD